MRVGDLPGLHEDRRLAAVNAELPVLDAAEMMTERGIGALVALSEGQMVGIFTERDLMRRVVAARRDPARTHVAEVMTASVRPVTLDDSVDHCLSVMREGGFRHLPVVDAGGEPFAMLSQRDFLVQNAGDAMRAFGTCR